MADKKKGDPPPPKLDQTVPGGRYIRGATIRDGEPYGGQVVNANGEVLGAFDPDTVNTGDPADADLEPDEPPVANPTPKRGKKARVAGEGPPAVPEAHAGEDR